MTIGSALFNKESVCQLLSVSKSRVICLSSEDCDN